MSSPSEFLTFYRRAVTSAPRILRAVEPTFRPTLRSFAVSTGCRKELSTNDKTKTDKYPDDEHSINKAKKGDEYDVQTSNLKDGIEEAKRRDLEWGDKVTELKRELYKFKRTVREMEEKKNKQSNNSAEGGDRTKRKAADKRASAGDDDYVDMGDSSDVEEEYDENLVDPTETQDYLHSPTPGQDDASEDNGSNVQENEFSLHRHHSRRRSISRTQSSQPIVIGDEEFENEEDKCESTRSQQKVIAVDDASEDEEDQDPGSLYHVPLELSPAPADEPIDHGDGILAGEEDGHVVAEEKAGSAHENYADKDKNIDTTVTMHGTCEVNWAELTAEKTEKIIKLNTDMTLLTARHKINLGKLEEEHRAEVKKLKDEYKSLEKIAFPELDIDPRDDAAVDAALGNMENNTAGDGSKTTEELAVGSEAMVSIDEIDGKGGFVYKTDQTSGGQHKVVQINASRTRRGLNAIKSGAVDKGDGSAIQEPALHHVLDGGHITTPASVVKEFETLKTSSCGASADTPKANKKGKDRAPEVQHLPPNQTTGLEAESQQFVSQNNSVRQTRAASRNSSVAEVQGPTIPARSVKVDSFNIPAKSASTASTQMRNDHAQLRDRKSIRPELSREQQLNILNICTHHQQGNCCRALHLPQGEIDQLLVPYVAPKPLKMVLGRDIEAKLKEEGICHVYHLGFCCKRAYVSKEEADKQIINERNVILRHSRVAQRERSAAS
ncbi:uncharacterized protein N0V89_007019 [Didymosphaeria variabile]|uniref:Uncharacterized protein n=1 Tax=Didymosphaeria variabile TaxID=1932322 RepID=A0A9W8XJB3_9PLEO|nr:uncharacterized protein N0V89_007019 [Didymosphaeria variabile]KAJ4351676.1 hypothetical protein N0V89_007019 [Didymosphaeria variabile]